MTYANDRQVDYRELSCGVARKVNWCRHGEILLGSVQQRWSLWELGIVGARIKRVSEDISWIRTLVSGTIKQGDHNRNLIGARQGVLRESFSVQPRQHNSTQKGSAYWPDHLNYERTTGFDLGTLGGIANFYTLPECAADKGSEGDQRCKLHRMEKIPGTIGNARSQKRSGCLRER
jgi:hypothetical protein